MDFMNIIEKENSLVKEISLHDGSNLISLDFINGILNIFVMIYITLD